jgi:hypothetical protein
MEWTEEGVVTSATPEAALVGLGSPAARSGRRLKVLGRRTEWRSPGKERLLSDTFKAGRRMKYQPSEESIMDVTANDWDDLRTRRRDPNDSRKPDWPRVL